MNNRIEWIDIFKGVAISLVVIGHATGKFNHYIYQFHMAGFFFISGYVSNSYKKQIKKVIWDKIYSLLIPYMAVFVFFLGLEKVLNDIGIRPFLFADANIYIGFRKSIVELLNFGNCYAWWLGAGWFVITLFGVEIVNRFLESIFKNIYSYIVILIITYGGGVYLAKSTINIHLGMFQLDLIFVGLLFYGVGRCFKRKQWETLLRKNIPIVLAVTICVLYYFGNINPITMDFPSRFFPNHFINLLTGINGSIFLMVFSLWISKVNFISNIFIYLGKNSIGIMFYHFMFFKVGFLFLHLLGIVPISYLQHFVPTDEIGRKYWCLMFANSIVFSTMLHELTKKIPIISFMLGMRKDKWNAIYYKLFDFPKEKDK